MNTEGEYPTCLPSLGEECGNCHRCTSPDAPRPAASVGDVAETVAQRILNTVDPLLPGHEVRMACVQIVRAHLAAALAEAGIGPIAEAERRLVEVEADRDALAAAVDRVRRRHPRGDEEGSYLAPGLWCPTCGHERSANGYGGCPDRQALIVPGRPLRAAAEGAS